MIQRLNTSLLAALALLAAGGPFAIDMYLPTLPNIAVDLHTSAAAVQLTISGFMFGMAVGQIAIGPVSDTFGRRGLLLMGASLAAVSAFACAVAPTIEVLIASRFALGLGSGACIVLARSVVADLATGAAAAKAFSIMMTIQGLAPVIAPVIGGILAEPLGWRGLFMVLAIIALLQLVVAFIMIKESLPVERRANSGAAEFFRGIRFVLSNRGFRGYTIAYALSFGGLFSYISASPFVYQQQLGVSPVWFSALFALNSLGLMLGSAVNARLVDRADPHVLVRNSMWVMAICGFGILIDALFGPHLFVVAALLFIAVLNLGFILGNATALGTGMVRERAGAGSAVMGFSQFVVAGIISALMGIGSNPALALGIGMAGCLTLGLVGLKNCRASQ
ncbi:multidrug effflux MFS transporter [Corynebacterium freiburgense]|uniref:multidrug effflux MFS transporter n=1 Tax=Corynebacterium freiburgense TaxID=556548 RepID=UPI00042A4D93|nr:multidrug effflux MFS transporter [Corynebacterium freiburgense]WJZ03731.1 Bicyclomycin resistance protein [Corynebacterium freiburgense]